MVNRKVLKRSRHWYKFDFLKMFRFKGSKRRDIEQGWRSGAWGVYLREDLRSFLAESRPWRKRAWVRALPPQRWGGAMKAGMGRYLAHSPRTHFWTLQEWQQKELCHLSVWKTLEASGSSALESCSTKVRERDSTIMGLLCSLELLATLLGRQTPVPLTASISHQNSDTH